MCKVLEKKLQLAGIKYEIMDDQDEMREMGLRQSPMLQVNCGPLMNFKEADAWIKEHKNG
jgi:hypothetical protein